MRMQLPVAVWVNRFQDAATAIFYQGRICNKSAVICAASADREFYMELTSNPLSPQLFEKLEYLYRHGLTIIEVPDYWVTETSRPFGWRDQLINLALDHVTKLPEPTDPEKPAPYDEALAHEVMTVLDTNYPHMVNIIDIKRALAVEPGDNVLMTALEALSYEKKIEGAPNPGSVRKLSTRVEVRLTSEGRNEVQRTKRMPKVLAVHGDAELLAAINLLHPAFRQYGHYFREYKLKEGVAAAFELYENRLNEIRDETRNRIVRAATGHDLVYKLFSAKKLKMPYPQLGGRTRKTAYERGLTGMLSGGVGWIRNAYTHEKHHLPNLQPQEALELLFVASYLLRMLDLAQVRRKAE